MSYRIIALLSIIAALVGAGTAAAATRGYWHGSGRGYDCKGISSGTVCYVGHYTTMISGTTIGVFYGTGSRPTPVWSCKTNRSMNSCLDLRP